MNNKEKDTDDPETLFTSIQTKKVPRPLWHPRKAFRDLDSTTPNKSQYDGSGDLRVKNCQTCRGSSAGNRKRTHRQSSRPSCRGWTGFSPPRSSPSTSASRTIASRNLHCWKVKDCYLTVIVKTRSRCHKQNLEQRNYAKLK